MSAWQVQDVPLRLQLSDLTVARVTLRLKVRQAARRPEVTAAGPIAPPDEPLGSALEGYLVRALPVPGQLQPLSRARHYLVYAPKPYTHYVIDLRSDFDTYKAKFSSKTRSTITRKVSRFAQHCGGALQWKRYTTPEELRVFHATARTVSQRTYQERLLDAGLPDSPEFVREMEALAADDRVRAFVLFDGERAVSYLYCPVESDTLVYAYLGYDPDYLRHSVGTVLFWLALESLFAEKRFTCFDFTEGESDHKRLFATHGSPAANVFFLRPTLRNQLLVRAHHAFSQMSAALGTWLDRLGLKARVRRMLRHRPNATAAES